MALAGIHISFWLAPRVVGCQSKTIHGDKGSVIQVKQLISDQLTPFY